jgi:hypothetical protein
MNQCYDSVDAFRKDLAEYALKHNFATRYINSDRKQNEVLHVSRETLQAIERDVASHYVSVKG